jgi:hypothetical protein
MAILLAQSIKHTQKSGYDKVAVVTDDKEKLSWLQGIGMVDHGWMNYLHGNILYALTLT